MKVAVVGAGAMGSILGAGLTEAGHDTILVDVAEPLVEQLNAHGLRITDREGEVRVVPVRATSDPGSVGAVEIVVFFVKCYHTASAAELARPLVDGGTAVVSLQNGWGNGDVLARTYDTRQLVVGVTYHSGTVRGLGEVAHTGVGPTFVGPFEGEGLARVTPVAEALASAGFDVAPTRQIRTEIWKKLVLNAATLPTAALTGLTVGALGQEGDVMLELVDEAAREATAVARALGYEIDERERVETIHALLGRGGGGKASMLQDLEAGRRTEVDVVNGAVLAAAREQGVDVPANRALLALVKGYERARSLS